MDRQRLHAEITAVYSRVARDPRGGFHFHRGLDFACDVLRPGGRIQMGDVLLRSGLHPHERANTDLWAGCVAAALRDVELLAVAEATRSGMPTGTVGILLIQN